jgi:RNA polymerase sigma-70 factor (ECF subfamily)
MRDNDAEITPRRLLDECGDAVFGLALRLAGNRPDAEDITQQALVRALRGLSAFRGDCALKTWTYRITVNVWKNWLRDRNRHAELQEWQNPVDSIAMNEPAATTEITDIESAVSKLPAMDRAVLTLREIDDYSYAEIARALEIPEGTVKSRIARARDNLRKLFFTAVREESNDA